MAGACLGCAARDPAMLVDFGPQPPSNRFERPADPPAERHPLRVAQCRACGLVQLADPMPPAMAKSRFEWLTYNEPEGHLDDLVSRLRGLVTGSSRIAGVSYKDDTTLARFNRLGYANTYRYQPGADLGIHDACAGLETLQDAFTKGSLSGQADLLLARHILEHAHDPARFIGALKKLTKPGGHMVFEVPEASKFIRACDYSFLWEEHITYFTRATLVTALMYGGVSLHEVHTYPYAFEDSLIAVVRNAAPASVPRDSDLLQEGAAFGRRHSEISAAWRERLAAWRRQGKRVAIFGAGHLAAKFVNLLGLADLVDCVIDDNAHKQALLMPGSRLPIRGSASLVPGRVDVCLLSLSPESEQKVRAKYASYLGQGGEFHSIFRMASHEPA
ncbi:MAG TPA: class I SAM-dependent methyltransferase [Burkholderiales bacterium]|nr:class I SAM-dependent methyltransferase [Burkholderiales bacterium]